MINVFIDHKNSTTVFYIPNRILYENKKVQNIRMDVLVKHIAILPCLATRYFFAEI